LPALCAITESVARRVDLALDPELAQEVVDVLGQLAAKARQW
jgi:ABC-type histidine transport system ATPase subunit